MVTKMFKLQTRDRFMTKRITTDMKLYCEQWAFN